MCAGSDRSGGEPCGSSCEVGGESRQSVRFAAALQCNKRGIFIG